MNLIFIYGPPAAGKLTVAKELSKQTNYKLFHNHLTYDTAYSLFGDDVYSKAFKECCENLRIIAIKEAVKYDVNMIFTFVYDHKNDHNFVKKISSIVERAGGKIYFICLNPSLETIKKRVVAENRKIYKKVSSQEELDTFINHYDIYSTIPDVKSYTINNTLLAPQDVAQEILTYMGTKQ